MLATLASAALDQDPKEKNSSEKGRVLLILLV